MAYFRRRQQQRLAAMVMACWLFALLVSVAHACGFDASPSEMMHAEAMTLSGHGDADDSTPSGCQQFCADDLPVLAKIKAIQDQSSAQPLLISLRSIEPLVTSGSSAPSRSRSPGPPAGTAVNIRFVRLAL